MKIMDIYEFRDMFSTARSAAFVGNASSVLTLENGRLIDSYDLVVRFNRAFVRGIEEKVGARTDILVANQSNSLASSPAPGEILRPKCVLTFIKPKKDKDITPLKEWVGEIPHCITLGPDIPSASRGSRHRTLTMGTYALYTFLRLFHLDRILLTGFTMFGMAPGGGEKYFEQEKNHGVGMSHELDVEAEIFSDIVHQFSGDLVMTPEVQALVEKFGPRDGKKPHSGRPRKAFLHYLSAKLMTAGFLLRRYVERDYWIEHDAKGRQKKFWP